MSHYQTEEQQLEIIKEFFKKYQTWLIWGMTALVLGLMGNQYWHQHRQTQNRQASEAFESLIQAVSSNQSVKAQAYASQLMSDYSSSVYGQAAALYQAKLEVEQGHLDQAKKYLNQAIDHAASFDLRDLAYVRLARIQLEQKDVMQAKKSLENLGVHSAYRPLVYELQGDLARAEHRISEARQDYQHALDLLSQQGIKNKILEMKLTQVVHKNNA